MKFVKFGQAKQILGIFKVGASKGFELNIIWIKGPAGNETGPNWFKSSPRPAHHGPQTRGLADSMGPPVSDGLTRNGMS